MLELAIEGVDCLHADDRELRREGPSYMVDTLLSFKEEDPDRELVLILGDEAVAGLMQWDQWERLLELAGLVVLKRPGVVEWGEALTAYLAPRWVEGRDAFMHGPTGRVVGFEGTQMGVSSTMIRSKIGKRSSVKFLLPNAVFSAIL